MRRRRIGIWVGFSIAGWLAGSGCAKTPAPTPPSAAPASPVAAKSYGEALPMAGLESLARRTPVITTDVGDCRSLAAGPDLLVPSSDPQALAAAMRHVQQLSASETEGLADRAEAIRTLKRLIDLGVNFIDTAEAYGPHVSEDLIREALHPYPAGLVIATKGGHDRPGPDRWEPNGRPEQLRQQVHGSLKRLGLEQIPLWQLHRIDPKVPRLSAGRCCAHP